MRKQTVPNAVVTDDITAPIDPVEAAPIPGININPESISITDVSSVAWAAATTMIRHGWTIELDNLPIDLKSTGYSIITLTRDKLGGEVSTLAVELAERLEAEAKERTRINYERDVQVAAQAMIEAEQKAAQAAKLAEEIAAQRAALAALEAKVAA